MKNLRRLCFLLAVLISVSASSMRDGSIAASISNFPEQTPIIADVYATGYFCVYNSELAGTQTVTTTISPVQRSPDLSSAALAKSDDVYRGEVGNNTYTLKASFLFGGRGVAMQGTGRTAPDGDYIKYTGGAGCFVHISGPKAGRNLKGQWAESPRVIRNRYARLGITDFTGFGNLALLYPERAAYSRASSVAGSTGQTLTPWLSISVDPSIIPLGQTGTLLFKNGTTTGYGLTQATFKADDIGSAIKGKHIEIYLGEGQSAYNDWLRSGGNRLVDVYPVR
jgi:3D (Asp-Asp-Asp) domain-containing protein